MTHKYTLSSIPGVSETHSIPAQSMLVSGGTSNDQEEFIYQSLVKGLEDGEPVLLITLDQSATSVLSTLESYLSDSVELSPSSIGIIDASGGSSDSVEGATVYRIESAGDLTGIGISMSKHIDALEEARGDSNMRVALLGMSPLIMYTNKEKTYRFLHVVTSRLDAVGALGMFLMNSGAHDEQTQNLLASLFDSQLEFESSESGVSVSVQNL